MPGYASLMKPQYGLMAAAFVWLGFLLAGSELLLTRAMIYAFVAAFLITSGAMVVNDIVDMKMDSHNKPKRPLPSGRASVGKAKALAAALLVAGNFFGLVLGISEFFFTIAISALFVAYETRLKRAIGLGHAIASLLFILPFLLGSFVFENMAAATWISAILFFAFLGKEVYKTIDDMLGEKRAGTDSIALRFGVLRAKAAAALLLLVAVVASFLPFVFGNATDIYLFFAIMADIVMVAAIAVPVRYSSLFVKISIAAMIFAFLLGTAQVQAIIFS